ncbi:TENA protein, partial [Polypterus senegalus]
MQGLRSKVRKNKTTGQDIRVLEAKNGGHGRLRVWVGATYVVQASNLSHSVYAVSPPKDLLVTEVTPETVNLTWHNEMTVTEYLITYVPTAVGGLELDFRVPGDKRAATIQELEPGVEYLVKVYAVLNNQKSIPVSARVSTHIPEPEGLRFKSVRETSVEVQWDPLEINFDGWDLIFRNTKEENGEVTKSLTRPETSYIQPGLGPGQEYEVTLHVVKNSSRGPGATKNVITRIDAPSKVDVRDVTDSTAIVTWFKPIAHVDGVSLSYGPSDEPAERKSIELSPNDRQYSFGNLRPDTEYEVTLVSRRGSMTSDPVSRTFTTELDAPKNLERVSQTENTVTLEWQNSKANVDSYRIKYSPLAGGDHAEISVPKSRQATTKATITGLRPGTEYGLGVTAVKSDRESMPATINAATELDSPRDLEVSGKSENSLSLRWKRPLSKINIYRLAYVSADGKRQEVEVPADATTYSLGGLESGMQYTITLTAERGRQKSKPASITATTASYLQYLADSAPEVTTRFKTFVQVKDPDSSGMQEDSAPDATRPMWSTDSPGTYGSRTVTYRVIPEERGPVEAHPQGNVSASPYGTRLPANTTEPSSRSPEAAASTASESAAPSVESAATRFTERPFLAHSTTPHFAFTAEMPSSTATPRLPTMPPTGWLSNISVTRVSDTDLSLQWMAHGGPFTSFAITVRDVALSTLTASELVAGDARRADVGALSPGTLYEVALQGEVDGRRSNAIKTLVTTEAEPALGALTVSGVSWDRFSLSWTAADGAFDRFTLEVADRDNRSVPHNHSVAGDVRGHSVTDVNAATTYRVTLVGFSNGSSSGPVYATASTAPEPDVTALFVSNITSDSFTVSWNATPGHFEGFVLELIDSSRLLEPAEYNVSGSRLSLDITGLSASTDYIVYLYGVTPSGQIPAISAAATTEPDLGRLSARNASSQSIMLSWTAREKAFDTFTLEIRETDAASQPAMYTVSGSERAVLIPGLKEATRYDFTLYGGSDDVLTAPLTVSATTASFFQTQPLIAARHQLASPFKRDRVKWGFTENVDEQAKIRSGQAREGKELPKVETLNITELNPHGFRVSWTTTDDGQDDRPEQFERFEIVVVDSGRLLEPHDFTVPGERRVLDIAGLITDIGYEVSVYGVTKTGYRATPLTTVAVTEAEPEVDNLLVSNLTTDSFRLSWMAEEKIFDNFLIKIRDSKRQAEPLEITVPGEDRNVDVTGLEGGTDYEIELYGVAKGHRSQPITGVATTGLGSPKGLRFSDVTDTTIMVHWIIPRARVDSYRVTYVPAEGGTPKVLTVDGTKSKTMLVDLTPGQLYDVSIVSVKRLDESEPSSGTVATGLDKPRRLEAINVTDSEALLHWQPTIATVDEYVITYSADNVPPVVERVSGNTVEFDLSALRPTTRYIVRIYAVRGAQQSATAITDFVTGVDAPQDLAASNIQTDGALLTWKAPIATITGYTLIFESADGLVKEVVLSPNAVSYNLAQLSASTQYTVKLQAIAGPERSKVVLTQFTTIGILYRHPRDCSQALLNGDTTSGIYTIYLNGDESQPVQVYCDMNTDGGGWMLFLRRQSGKLDFYRNWKNYSLGFGDLNDEFWLGLDNLHKITTSGQYELRVDLRDGEETAYAHYDKFSVSDGRSRYKVSVGGYSGTAGDSMTYHQGRPFSTYDKDNDVAVTNCALSYKGAFWYKNCHRVNLMGRYGDNSHSQVSSQGAGAEGGLGGQDVALTGGPCSPQGINWFHWKGHEYSIQFADMKIRPSNFRNLEGRRKRS